MNIDIITKKTSPDKKISLSMDFTFNRLKSVYKMAIKDKPENWY